MNASIPNRSIKSYGIRLPINRLAAIVGVSVYPFLLLWSLKSLIAPNWGYMGFGFDVPDDEFTLITALFLAIWPVLIMPLSGSRPSSVALWILYLLVYIPAQIVPGFSSGQDLVTYGAFQFILSIGFVLLVVISSLPLVRFPRLDAPSALYWLGILAFSIMAFVVIVATYGLPTRLPSLGSVYDVRSAFGDESAGQSTLLAYLMSWQGRVINPLLMAFGVVRRRPAPLMLGFIGQLLLFALAGHKSVAFSALLVIGILFALRNRGRGLGVWLAWGAPALVILSIVLDIVFNSVVLTSLFVRRLLLVPGLLTGYYHEYFSNNIHTNDLGALTRWLSETTYEVRIPNLIGQVYFSNPATNANANFWADGYAAFDMGGVLIVSVLLGVMLWVFNCLALERDAKIASVLVGISAFNLVNSALMTSIGTHGIGFALVLLYLLPRDRATEQVLERN